MHWRTLFSRGTQTIDAGPQPVPPAEREKGGETILLVEDEPAVRMLFAQALRRGGYQLLEARHGPEALRMFEEHSDAIDLLLTDVKMPLMNGSELAQQILARRPELKLLYISGHMVQGDLGAHAALLTKPFLPHQLLRKVRDVLDGTD